jgi:hypothetical protein
MRVKSNLRFSLDTINKFIYIVYLFLLRWKQHILIIAIVAFSLMGLINLRKNRLLKKKKAIKKEAKLIKLKKKQEDAKSSKRRSSISKE